MKMKKYLIGAVILFFIILFFIVLNNNIRKEKADAEYRELVINSCIKRCDLEKSNEELEIMFEKSLNGEELGVGEECVSDCMKIAIIMKVCHRECIGEEFECIVNCSLRT